MSVDLPQFRQPQEITLYTVEDQSMKTKSLVTHIITTTPIGQTDFYTKATQPSMKTICLIKDRFGKCELAGNTEIWK